MTGKICSNCGTPSPPPIRVMHPYGFQVGERQVNCPRCRHLEEDRKDAGKGTSALSRLWMRWKNN
ncbi:hypothetical protein ACUN8C_05850 [Kushneria sp. Sum13]|uniref:hypothetical protein n=1 Tax=Kushneria sp. Sum13 TaxID=3459196 RepID=UPI004045C20A